MFKLAETTASRLAAVAVSALAEDSSFPASVLDKELSLLEKDLESWSPYLAAERQIPAGNQ